MFPDVSMVSLLFVPKVALSENYFQHADHFIRIQAEKEKNRLAQDDVNKIGNEKKVEVQESQEKKLISN